MRAKNNRVREGNGRRFQGRRKGKEKSFCFVVVQFELVFRHPCFYVVCACIEFFGEVGHFTERSGFLELCVICEKLMVYRVVSYDIGDMYHVSAQSVDERMINVHYYYGPISTGPWYRWCYGPISTGPWYRWRGTTHGPWWL